MSRGALVRLLLVLGLLGGCAAIALSASPRLGLDLRGGTQITLQTQDTERVKADGEATDRADRGAPRPGRRHRRRRAHAGARGRNRIIVELPDVQDPRQAHEVLGRTAQLTVTRSSRRPPGPNAKPSKHGNLSILQRDGGLPRGRPRGDGRQRDHRRPGRAAPAVGRLGRQRRLHRQGLRHLRQAHRQRRVRQGDPRRVAIVLDEAVISSPEVPGAVRGQHHRHHQHPGGFNETGQRPRHPDRGRRAAGAGRGDRAAHRRADAGEAAIEASWQAALSGWR